MSPTRALDNPIFLIYAGVILGLLLVAGVVLAVLRGPLGRDVSAAWRAYLGWLMMGPLILTAVFLGREATIVFFGLVAWWGVKEFARATGLYRDWWMMSVVYLGVAAVVVVSLVHDPTFGTAGWYGLFVALPVYVIAIIMAIPILRNQSQGQLQKIALAIVAFIYIGWMFGHVSFMANAKQAYGYVLFLLLAVELNDTAAFIFGRLFGRHPLRCNISPRKTWEGFIGAAAVSMALPWILWFSFPHFQPRELLLTGLIVGLGGQMGDLSLSVIKRDLGIKDMGQAIHGHGGVLDRIDSLIYAAPLFFHMARYFHPMQP